MTEAQPCVLKDVSFYSWVMGIVRRIYTSGTFIFLPISVFGVRYEERSSKVTTLKRQKYGAPLSYMYTTRPYIALVVTAESIEIRTKCAYVHTKNTS